MCSSTKIIPDTKEYINVTKAIVEQLCIVKNQYSYAAAVLKDKMAIADASTTGHFLQINSECVDKRHTNEELNVHLRDGSVINSTHTALLNIL